MFEIGTTVGDLRLEALQRTTGGGSIYTALQSGLGRPVTVYVADAPSGSEAGQRFLADVTRLASIEDRHLLPVYEVRTVNDRIVAIGGGGESRLADLLAEGPLAPERAVAIVGQMVAAVEALERAGVTGVLPSTTTVATSADGEARFSAVEALLDEPGDAPSGSAVARFADLLATSTSVPAALRPVIARAAQPGGFTSGRELVDAARSTLPVTPPARHRRRPAAIAAVAVVAACVVVAVVLLSTGEDAPKHAPANAPAARIAAVIDVGGAARSIGVGEGGVWVGRQDRQLVRIDPTTNRVVGAPLRFAPPVPANDTNVTVRAGAGAVFAMDSSSRTVVRIDPKTMRITGRKGVGRDILGALVAGRELWVLTGPPTKLLRLDAGTLRQLGSPIGAGTLSFDVESDGPVAYLPDAQGNFARIDTRTGHVDRFSPAGSTYNMALRDGVLWIPDSPNGTLLQIDAHSLKPRGEVVRGLSHATTATTLGDSIWVTTLQTSDPASPNELHRIDAATGRQAGRPVVLGTGVGWPQAGAGALWISSERGIIKVRPTSPAPATTPNPPPPKDHGELLGGPLESGTYTGHVGRSRLSVRVDDDGWLAVVEASDVQLVRLKDSDTNTIVFLPSHVFDRRGGLVLPHSVGQILRTLRANPHLIVGPAEHATIGGEPAVGVMLDVRAGAPLSEVCTHRCLPLLEMRTGGGFAVERGVRQWLWLLRRRGQILGVATSGPSPAKLDAAEQLLETLRFLP
jgi:hypothetical protein